jgi:hypothetical protein
MQIEITKAPNLLSNGFVKTSNGDGTFIIDSNLGGLMNGPPCIELEEPENPYPIPGIIGPTGIQGIQGQSIPGIDGIDGENEIIFQVPDTSRFALASNLSAHIAETTTAHGLGASAFHADAYFLLAGGTAVNSALLENHNAAYFQIAGSYALINQTFYIGTTQVAINRASAALSLADISVTGTGTWNAGAVTSSGPFAVNSSGSLSFYQLQAGGTTYGYLLLSDVLGETAHNTIVYTASGKTIEFWPGGVPALTLAPTTLAAAFASTINGITITTGTITSAIWNAGAVTTTGLIQSNLITDATSVTTGGISTLGGISCAKAIWCGTNFTLGDVITMRGADSGFVGVSNIYFKNEVGNTLSASLSADDIGGTGIIFAVNVNDTILTLGHDLAAQFEGSVKIVGAFGCNNKSVQTAYASGGALAAYTTGAFGLNSDANMSALHAMVVSIRAALVANGIMS